MFSMMAEETKKKISNAKRGSTPWNKGKKGLQIAWNKGVVGSKTGEKNGMWKGGISSKYKLARLEKAAGRERSEECEICRKQVKTCFDHDHCTGEFRGWICRRCNLVLGMVKDSIYILRFLQEYLAINDINLRPGNILGEIERQINVISSDHCHKENSSPVKENQDSAGWDLSQQDNFNSTVPN